jgi:two-component system sensor histidine kinase YesM
LCIIKLLGKFIIFNKTNRVWGNALKKRFFSLQYKLLFFSLVIILIPILTLGIFSYNESLDIVKQKVSISNLNTVRQVGERVEAIFQDAHDLSLFLIRNDDVRKFFMLENADGVTEAKARIIQLNNELMYLLSTKPYIYSIYFKGFNGISTDTRNSSNPIDPDIEEELIRLKGGYIWDIGNIINYGGMETKVFSLMRVYNDMNYIPNRLAIMKINIDEQEISQIYSSEITGENNEYFIINNDNNIISSIDKGKVGTKLNSQIVGNIPKHNKEGYFQEVVNGNDYLITYYYIDNMDYTIVNTVPLKELLKDNSVIQIAMLEVAGLSFIVCVLFAFLFSTYVLQPLKNICAQMKKVENEDFDVQVNCKRNDEIAMLGRSFNKMSLKLKELINQVYLVNIKQKEAELAALHAQINPHFLYNTLDTIYWVSRKEKAPETGKLIEALAKLFRLSLNNGKELILLNSEVEHLKNYLVIQKKRYGNSIKFSLDIEEELLDCKVLKLILQPLLENAIVHGIDKKEGKGNINVTIKKSDGNIIYEIVDDGIGIDVDEAYSLLENTTESNKGIGIKNINDRLKLSFGDQYGLQFFHAEGGGTKVVVLHPYIKGVD